MKLCHKCNTEKELCEFHADSQGSDGHHTICKACKKQYRDLRMLSQGKIVRDQKVIEDGMLLCTKCNNKKLLNDFPKVSKSKLGYHSYCKSCVNSASRSLRDAAGIPPRYVRTIVDGTLKCGKCNESKPIEMFTKSRIRKNEYSSMCKPCQKEWRANNKEKVRHAVIRRMYGIDGDTYIKMKADQNDKCIICNALPSGIKKDVLHIDHDHTTKKVRGLLCSACNTALGLFKENTDNMLKAIDYINKHKELA